MELMYDHDGLDIEIVAPRPDLARQGLYALVSSVVLFFVGLCGSFVVGAVVAGVIEAQRDTDIPLTLELFVGFTAVGVALTVAHLAVWAWLLWRRWQRSRYQLSIDAKRIRVLHDGREHSWPMAGCRAMQDGADLLLIPMEARAFRIPLTHCTEAERTLITEALQATRPQLEEPGAPPAELEALRRKGPDPST